VTREAAGRSCCVTSPDPRRASVGHTLGTSPAVQLRGCLNREPRGLPSGSDVTPHRCIVCGRPAVTFDRCDTCYRFVRRNGFDRDPGRNMEANRRRLERELEEAWLIHAQISG